jgi:hypothetical protein
LKNCKQEKLNQTSGDIRCIIFGQLTRLAIWHLREKWDKEATFSKKAETVAAMTARFGGLAEIDNLLNRIWPSSPHYGGKYSVARI